MGNETTNKKEREKKRHKKRKEKEERRLERKANSNKGKSLDDMIAYVDEHGRITSTPPDATRKVEVRHEDIQIGVPKREEADPADAIHTGTVTNFNHSKGFGFIRDHLTQESVFVHVSSLSEQINEGNKVTFEIQESHRGFAAVKVKLVK